MKKFSVLLLSAVMLLTLLTACGGQQVGTTGDLGNSSNSTGQGDEPAESKFRVGLCLSIGGRGDQSFNDQAYDGVMRAVEELGIEMDLAEPHEYAEIEPFLVDFAKAGIYDVIIGIGYDAAQPIKEVAPLYPDQKFLLVDNACNDIDNVASLTFNKSEEGFLTGIFCAYFANLDSIVVNGETIALDNSSKVIGAILGVENPDILEAIAGLYAGLKYVDPEVQPLYNSVGSWTDQNKAREIAMAQYDQGATIIWQDAGSSGLGVFTAAADRELFTLGWNTPQHTVDPDHILCSVVKTLNNSIYEWIKAYYDSGEFVSGNSDNGCANGSVYMVYSDSFEVPQEIVDAVEAGHAKLASGEIVSPLTLEAAEAFDLRQE